MLAGEAGAQAEGAHAVVVKRAHFLRDFGGAVPVGLAFGNGDVAQVGDARKEHARVAGEADVRRGHVGQKEAVVGNARAHAGAGHVPPVHHVAGGKLPRRAEKEMFAGQRRLKMHQRQHILQLVAEAVGAAGLIEPGAGAHAGVERLLDKPWEEAIERLVASLDAQRAQARAPRFFRFCQRRGMRAQGLERLQGFLVPFRPADGEVERSFLARCQRDMRLQRPAALAAAPFKEAVRAQNAAMAEKGRALRARFRRGVKGGEVGYARHRPVRQTYAVLVPGVQIGGIARVHAQQPVDEGGDGALAIPAGGVAHRHLHAEGVGVRADVERRFKAQAVRAAQKAGMGQRMCGAEGREGRFAGQKARIRSPALVGQIEHQAPTLAQRVVVKRRQALHAAVLAKEEAAAALGDDHAEVLSGQHVRPCDGRRLGGVDSVTILGKASVAVEERAADRRQLHRARVHGAIGGAAAELQRTQFGAQLGVKARVAFEIQRSDAGKRLPLHRRELGAVEHMHAAARADEVAQVRGGDHVAQGVAHGLFVIVAIVVDEHEVAFKAHGAVKIVGAHGLAGQRQLGAAGYADAEQGRVAADAQGPQIAAAAAGSALFPAGAGGKARVEQKRRGAVEQVVGVGAQADKAQHGPRLRGGEAAGPLARAFGGIAFLPAFHILRGQEGDGEMGLARFPGFQTQPQAQRGAGSERAAQRTGQCARGSAFAAFKALAIRLPCHFSAQRQRGEGVGTAPRPARPARKDERALRRARGGNEEILKGGVRPAIVAGAEGHGEGKRQFHFPRRWRAVFQARLEKKRAILGR